MKDLINRFIKLRKDFLETLAKFPEDKREEVLFHEWSLKDVLSHLIGWDVYFINAARFLRDNKKLPYWVDIDEHNKREVEERKSLSYRQVYNNFIKKSEEFINEYSHLSEELKDKLIWPDKKYTLLRFLKTNIHHYRHHLEKIEKILDQKS